MIIWCVQKFFVNLQNHHLTKYNHEKTFIFIQLLIICSTANAQLKVVSSEVDNSVTIKNNFEVIPNAEFEIKVPE